MAMSRVRGLCLPSKTKEQVYPLVGSNYGVTIQVPERAGVNSELCVSLLMNVDV